MKKLKYLLPLALFIVLAGFLVKGLYLDPHEVPSPLIGKPAPAFQLQDLNHLDRTVSSDGEGLAPECLGFLVRKLPGRASVHHAACPQR